MKPLATLSLLLFSFYVNAQVTEAYYDYQWKPCAAENARFYSKVEKTDSGWFRRDYFLSNKNLQMQALFEDNACKTINGHCYYFFANGNVDAIGHMVHNKEEGAYVRYYSNGMIADSAFYHNGIPTGSRIKWYRNGFMSDSIFHANDSMDIQVSWFDDGAVAAAGYFLRGKPYGKWKFYHRNGNLSEEEVYAKGEAVSKTYYNEDGSPRNDTASVNKQPAFKNGIKAWQQYLSKNLNWPHGLEFSNGTMAVVVVGFTVNEEGKIEDEEVIVPFHPAFDIIALRVIHNSPQWTPGMMHNRKVKYHFRQPVTFQQQED